MGTSIVNSRALAKWIVRNQLEMIFIITNIVFIINLPFQPLLHLLKLIITTNVVVYSLLVIIILLIVPQNIVIYTVVRLFVLYFDLNTFFQRRHHIALLILFSHRSHFICKLLVKLKVLLHNMFYHHTFASTFFSPPLWLVCYLLPSLSLRAGCLVWLSVRKELHVPPPLSACIYLHLYSEIWTDTFLFELSTCRIVWR